MRYQEPPAPPPPLRPPPKPPKPPPNPPPPPPKPPYPPPNGPTPLFQPLHPPVPPAPNRRRLLVRPMMLMTMKRISNARMTLPPEPTSGAVSRCGRTPWSTTFRPVPPRDARLEERRLGPARAAQRYATRPPEAPARMRLAGTAAPCTADWFRRR